MLGFSPRWCCRNDAEIQRLQAELDRATGGGAPTSLPRGYVQFRVHAELGGLGLLISSAPDEPISQARRHVRMAHVACACCMCMRMCIPC